MDNVISKGVLLTVCAALVSFGVEVIQVNFWQGLIALVVGALVFIARELLKVNGYDVAATLGYGKK